MNDKKSIATGSELNAETWADFVERLRHDCHGKGVNWHHTAAALFTVQTQRTDYGFERDYAEGLVVCLEESCWFSPAEYWADLDDDEQARIEREAKAREADKAHKKTINNEALAAFIAGGMPEECAKQAITLIAKRCIPHIHISY